MLFVAHFIAHQLLDIPTLYLYTSVSCTANVSQCVVSNKAPTNLWNIELCFLGVGVIILTFYYTILGEHIVNATTLMAIPSCTLRHTEAPGVSTANLTTTMRMLSNSIRATLSFVRCKFAKLHLAIAYTRYISFYHSPTIAHCIFAFLG